MRAEMLLCKVPLLAVGGGLGIDTEASGCCCAGFAFNVSPFSCLVAVDPEKTPAEALRFKPPRLGALVGGGPVSFEVILLTSRACGAVPSLEFTSISCVSGTIDLAKT